MTVASVSSSLSDSINPRLAVRLPCALASISRTFFPYLASPIPKLPVVVLPTPPFWFAIVIILHMVFSSDFLSFFHIYLIHFHISSVKPVCPFILVKLGKLRYDNFRLSFQDFLEPAYVISCSHHQNINYISNKYSLLIRIPNILIYTTMYEMLSNIVETGTIMINEINS